MRSRMRSVSRPLIVWISSLPELEALDHRRQRDRVGASGDVHEERGDDGEGQRELDDELRAHPGHRLHLDQAVEALDRLQHDVEAHARGRRPR